MIKLTVTDQLLQNLAALRSDGNIQMTEYLIPETHLKEKAVTDYPAIALRELLMNAVMHRSYEYAQVT